MTMITMTPQLLRTLLTDKGGMTRETFLAIGVEWPPESGWRRRIMGKEYGDDEISRAMEGRLMTVKAKRKAQFEATSTQRHQAKDKRRQERQAAYVSRTLTGVVLASNAQVVMLADYGWTGDIEALTYRQADKLIADYQKLMTAQ